MYPSRNKNLEPTSNLKTIKFHYTPSPELRQEQFYKSIDFDEVAQHELSMKVSNSVDSYLRRTLKPIKIVDVKEIFKFELRQNKLCRVLGEKVNVKSDSIIVTNGNVGTQIFDSSLFSLNTLKRSKLESNFMYKAGQYNGIDMYINSFMPWNETNIYLIKKPFYNFNEIKIGDLVNDPFSFLQKKEIRFNLFFDENIRTFVEMYKID